MVVTVFYTRGHREVFVPSGPYKTGTRRETYNAKTLGEKEAAYSTKNF
jgi:hypothetical protein